MRRRVRRINAGLYFHLRCFDLHGELQEEQWLNKKAWWRQLFRWQMGRQKTGYDKMLLAGGFWPLPFDVYLLRFNEGSEIPPHVDVVEKGEHYRLNIVLKAAKSGGDFICDKPIYESSRIKYFRSDICEHAVSKVLIGRRYVLSLGWVKNA